MTEWDSIWAHFEFRLSGRCCDAAETLPGRSRDVAGQTRTAFVAGQKIRTADGRDVFGRKVIIFGRILNSGCRDVAGTLPGHMPFWSRICTMAHGPNV